MTANYLVCNIEDTESRAQNRKTCLFFLLLSDKMCTIVHVIDVLSQKQR